MPFFEGTGTFYTDGGFVRLTTDTGDFCPTELEVGDIVLVDLTTLNDGEYEVTSKGNCGINVLNFPDMSFLSEVDTPVSFTIVEPPPATTTWATSTPATLDDIAFGINLIIVVLSVAVIGFIFNSFTKKRY